MSLHKLHNCHFDSLTSTTGHFILLPIFFTIINNAIINFFAHTFSLAWIIFLKNCHLYNSQSMSILDRHDSPAGRQGKHSSPKRMSRDPQVEELALKPRFQDLKSPALTFACNCRQILSFQHTSLSVLHSFAFFHDPLQPPRQSHPGNPTKGISASRWPDAAGEKHAS